MTLLTHKPIEKDLDAEVLIQEARHLRRRRWAIGTSCLLVATLLAAGIYIATDQSPPKRTHTPSVALASTNRPFINVKAFSHSGELAFISQNRLWDLDGTQQSVRQLPVARGFVPASPSFSADGKWLAYLGTYTTPGQGVSQTDLWIARANGTDAHEVPGVAVGGFVGWSSTSDEVAVMTTTTDPLNPEVHWPTGVRIVSPSGMVRTLVSLKSTATAPTTVYDAVWSPDGREVAVATNNPFPNGGTAITAYPINGAAPTVWFSIGTKQVLPGICTGCGGGQTIADLAGWWPGWGIGFWVYSSGMDHNNDGAPVELLTAPNATPHIIGQTLSDGTTVAIDSAPDGALAIVGNTGDREYGQGKVVETCNRQSLSCTPIHNGSVWSGKPLPCPATGCFNQPAVGSAGSGVTLDPAWSPDGNLLAYVNAPSVPDDVAPLVAWYNDHELMLLNTATHNATNVAELKGASVPTWSRNGKDLLYVDNDSLWMWPIVGGKPVEIASPLFPEQEWRGSNTAAGENLSYYDQVDWTGQFSWSSP